MKILLVAADRMEFAGILGHAAGVRKTAVAVRWARQAELAGNSVLLAANGVGKRCASAAVDAALRTFAADAIVSVGFCGALSPALGIADIVCATSVDDGSRRFPALAPASPRPHRLGVILSRDRVAQAAAEKRLLHENGGMAVEMEAAGVAGRAAEHGIGFYCVRVVSDLAGEDMANDFNGALRDDGRFATISLLTGTLRNPLVRIPELLRLRSRCAGAALVLGDFIADCRF